MPNGIILHGIPAPATLYSSIEYISPLPSPTYMMAICKNAVAKAIGCLLIVNALACGSHAAVAGSKTVDFNRDIRPLLSDNCFHCHGPDSTERKAELRLDTMEGAYKDLGGYQAVKPGNVAASELWKRITNKDPDDIMPPVSTHKQLKPEQIDLFRRWIEQGGEYKGHWSFTPPVRPETPKVKTSKWPLNPIDNFIAQKFEAKGFAPNPEGAKEVLIRRVTFDLTGLPPTPQEVDAFLADKKPDAYNRLVNRLLESPRYGEHMARYWLDAARYGDTHGLHLDNERSMWPYRDWVVRSFNRNLPFSDFTVEQIAGDLLPNATRDQIIASGFNRCNVTTSEGGSINEEFLFRYAVDRTETTAAVWMGLTAGCAVCHDHKFDPISQKEFYQLYAFFNNAADPAMDGNILLTAPILKLTSAEQQKKLDEFDGKIADVQKKVKAALAKVVYVDPVTLTPPPTKRTNDTVWVDDNFPPDAKPKVSDGADPLKWVTAEDGVVLSGKRALKRSAKALAQDYFADLTKPFTVPANGKIYAHVYLDPNDPPKAVMLQFNTGAWANRGVWGDVEAIDFGKKGTVERMAMGVLPKLGEWVRLEFPATKVGLKAGTKIAGLAFTQFGGTVYWDKVGVIAESDPVNDPAESQAAWEKQNQGKLVKDVPKDLQEIFRSISPKDRKPQHITRLREYYLENIYSGTRDIFDSIHAEVKPLQEKRDEFDKTIPATLVMKELEKTRESFVMVRGQYDKPGVKVTRNVPAILPPLKSEGAPSRLDLAKWLVDPQHPLTARVTVNRFWQQFFGTGIVKTSGDFGSQGQPPSHPELLDWLATTFVSSGWDVKNLCKLIVTSATYRQDSKTTKRHLEIDPENRLLAHGARFRLDAEEIRDNALFVSGLLNPEIGGKAVRPYQPENIWEPVAYSGSNTKVYKQDEGDALYRRSLYTFWKRTAPPPAMTTFDAPSRESFCVRRERSDTPLQALLLMNDIQHYEAARNLAQRMLAEGGAKPEDRINFAFRLVTSRTPNKNEQSVLKKTLDGQLAKYRANVEAAKQAISVGASKPKADLDPAEIAAYTLVANLLLNLDETLNKN